MISVVSFRLTSAFIAATLLGLVDTLSTVLLISNRIINCNGRLIVLHDLIWAKIP